jgi:hypothetical protein
MVKDSARAIAEIDILITIGHPASMDGMLRLAPARHTSG